MKTTYKRSQPKITTYCSYKYFHDESLKRSLQIFLQIECNGNNCYKDCKDFTLHAILFWIRNTPRKRYVRSNQSPFSHKILSKAVTQRFKFRNIFLKNRTEENRNNYAKQRNLFHFWEKVQENLMAILVRINYVIIRNFGMYLSLHYRI